MQAVTDFSAKEPTLHHDTRDVSSCSVCCSQIQVAFSASRHDESDWNHSLKLSPDSAQQGCHDAISLQIKEQRLQRGN